MWCRWSGAAGGARSRAGDSGVQHHGALDSSDGAAISPRPLSGLVCATEAGATSPNLTYWLSPDRIYIQSRGREGGTEERDGGEGRGRHSSPCRALVQDNHRQPLLTSTQPNHTVNCSVNAERQPIEGAILNVCLIALFLIHYMTALLQFLPRRLLTPLTDTYFLKRGIL